MIEAMSTGTPVIAWRNGSVPEVVEDGLTGEIADSVEAAAKATRRIARLDRRIIRDGFEARFTAARMAADYVEVYHVILRADEQQTLQIKAGTHPVDVHRVRLPSQPVSESINPVENQRLTSR
jgi:hypothetical protein